jgi:hypothetical protein
VIFKKKRLFVYVTKFQIEKINLENRRLGGWPAKKWNKCKKTGFDKRNETKRKNNHKVKKRKETKRNNFYNFFVFRCVNKS